MAAKKYIFKKFQNKVILVNKDQVRGNSLFTHDFRFLTDDEIVTIFQSWLIEKVKETKSDSIMIYRGDKQAFCATVVNKDVCEQKTNI